MALMRAGATRALRSARCRRRRRARNWPRDRPQKQKKQEPRRSVSFLLSCCLERSGMLWSDQGMAMSDAPERMRAKGGVAAASTRAPPSSPGACAPCAPAPQPGVCGACSVAHNAGADAPQRGCHPVGLFGRIASTRLQMSRPLGSQFDSRLTGAVRRTVRLRRSAVPASPFLRCRHKRDVRRTSAFIARQTAQQYLLAYHIAAHFLLRIFRYWP